jgi:serine acetyltransferase
MHTSSRVSVQTHIAKRCNVGTKMKIKHEMGDLI